MHLDTVQTAQSKFKRVADNLFRNHKGRYYALVKRGGKQIKKSLGTDDKALAKHRLKAFLAKADRVNTSSEHRSIRFDELCTRWLASIKPDLKFKAWQRRQTAVNKLSPYFANLPVRAIGQPQLDAWKASRAQNIAPRTWNIELETLRLLFDYAKEQLQCILDNPAERLNRRKVTKKVAQIPTRVEFARLISELRSGHRSTGQAADLVEFLAYSGCRLGEAVEVRWRDVDGTAGRLLVTGGKDGTKNHNQYALPLFPALRRLLTSMRERQKPECVEDRVFSIRTAKMQLERACDRLGMRRWGHHSMRHFFCSNAIEANIDFKTIAAWLNHKDGGVLVATTYGHLRQEHSDAMAEKMTFAA